MKGKLVVLGVTGSIAAYKAPIVARLLTKAGVEVQPVLTKSAHAFVGAATFSGLLQRAVASDMFAPGAKGELHVELAQRADLIAIVPATADFLARLASGRADDLLAATCLSSERSILAAPAMHPAMWRHPATQRNLAILANDARVRLVGPVEGEVASGDVGLGRMADPEQIAAAILAALGPQDLAGRHVVVSAGPTVEDVDPVRFIGNRSSGKMGFALAERAAARGARVTLVAGPVALPTPAGVTRIDVRGALSMKAALWQVLGEDLGGADALIMSAAVGDYRPREALDHKLKRSGAAWTLELVPNPDVLAEIGAARAGKQPLLVGFAVETVTGDALIAEARKKLASKRVDWVVANEAGDAFGRDDNRAVWVGANEAVSFGLLHKQALADRILDQIARALS